VICSPTSVLQGEDSNCAATPGDGFRISAWGGACAGAASSSNCALTNIQEDQTVTVSFEAVPVVTYAVGVTVDGIGGSAVCSPETVQEGEDSICTATPEAGFRVSSWSGACSAAGDSNSCSLTDIRADLSSSVAFEEIPPPVYSVTATVSGGNGSVSCEPDTVLAGVDSLCTATPNEGYEVSAWSGACAASGTAETCTISNVQADQSVSVSFSATGGGAPPDTVDVVAYAEIVAGPDAEGDIAVGFPVTLEVGIEFGGASTGVARDLRAVVSGQPLASVGPACTIQPDGESAVCQWNEALATPGSRVVESITVTAADRDLAVVVSTSNPENGATENNEKSLTLGDFVFSNDARVFAIPTAELPADLPEYVVGFRMYDEVDAGITDWTGVVRVPKVPGLAGVAQLRRTGERDCRDVREETTQFVVTCLPGQASTPEVFLVLSVATGGQYLASAQVEDRPAYDPDPDNNTATAGLSVGSVPPLVLRGIEVTQALQDLENSVPLYQGKTTVVRVHLDDPAALNIAVSGRLLPSSQGIPLLDGERTPLRSVRPQEDYFYWRNFGAVVLEFAIPTLWTRNFSSLDFRFELDGQGRALTCAEPDASPDCSVRVNFLPVTNPKVDLMTVGYWTDEAFALVIDRDIDATLDGRFRIAIDGLVSGAIGAAASAQEVKNEILATYGQRLALQPDDLVVTRTEWELPDATTIRRRWVVSFRNRQDHPDATVFRNDLQFTGGSGSLSLVNYRDGGEFRLPNFTNLIEQYLRLVTGVPAPRVTGSFRMLAATFDHTPSMPEVNSRLRLMRDLDAASNPALTPDVRYAAYLLGGAPQEEFSSGQSRGQVFAWYDSGASDLNSASPSRNVGLHEMYHSYGKQHAVVERVELEDGTRETRGLCDSWGRFEADLHPYVQRLAGTGAIRDKREGFPADAWPLIGPLNLSVQAEIWGFDTRFLGNSGQELRVIDPRASSALMSYCTWPQDDSIRYADRVARVDQNRWPALNEYLAVADSISNGFIGLPGNVNYVGPVTVFTGAVGDRSDVAGNTIINLLGSVVEDTGPAEAEDGIDPVVVSLLDEAGATLATQTVLPVFSPDQVVDASLGGIASPGATQYLSAILPNPAFAARTLVVARNGTELLRLTASPSVPSVDYLAPAALADDPVTTIRWQSSDQDGDDLTAAVLYSRDDGVTWQTLSAGITDDYLQVPTALLGSTARGRFRVVVSDGFNSAEAESPPLAVDNTAPTIVITQPAVARVEADESLLLEAVAADVEDGVIDSDAIAWSSDVDGELGSGSPLALSTGALSAGCHLITATVSDSDGVQSVDRVALGVAADCASARQQGTLRVFLDENAPDVGPVVFNTSVATSPTISLVPGQAATLQLPAGEVALGGFDAGEAYATLDCDDPSGGTLGGLPGGASSISLGAAETVSCRVAFFSDPGRSAASARPPPPAPAGPYRRTCRHRRRTWGCRSSPVRPRIACYR
jgi:hypothetical protein